MSGRAVTYRGSRKIDVWLKVEGDLEKRAIRDCIGSKKAAYAQMQRDEVAREWVLRVFIPKDSGWY